MWIFHIKMFRTKLISNICANTLAGLKFPHKSIQLQNLPQASPPSKQTTTAEASFSHSRLSSAELPNCATFPHLCNCCLVIFCGGIYLNLLPTKKFAPSTWERGKTRVFLSHSLLRTRKIVSNPIFPNRDYHKLQFMVNFVKKVKSLASPADSSVSSTSCPTKSEIIFLMIWKVNPVGPTM